MTAIRKIAVGLAASAITLATAVGGASTASAAGEHTIVFSNKSVVFNICFTSKDSGGKQIKKKCTTWAAGAAGGTYRYRVPSQASTTRFTARDIGSQEQELAVDLANTQNWCYRAPASGAGRIDGPINPCRP